MSAAPLTGPRRRRVPADLVLVGLGALWTGAALELASKPMDLGPDGALVWSLLILLATAWLIRVATVWCRRREVTGRWWPLALAPVVVMTGAILASTTVPFDVRWSASRDDFSTAVHEIAHGRDPDTYNGSRLGLYRIVFIDRTHDGHLRFITHTDGVSFAGFAYATSPPDESRYYFTYRPFEPSWYRTIGV